MDHINNFRSVIIDLHSIVINCMYWKVYTTSLIKKQLYNELEKNLSVMLYDIIESYQGKHGTIVFTGNQITVEKYDSCNITSVAEKCVNIEVDQPAKNALIDISNLLYNFIRKNQ